MKFPLWLGTAIAVLALSAPANAVQDSVEYDDALKCSALYSILAGSIEGEPEEEALIETASRWLVVAMNRDGTEDGSRADQELEGKAFELLEKLESFGDDEDQMTAFLEFGVNWCDEKQAVVIDEFDAAEV